MQQDSLGSYEYDAEANVLDVYFDNRRPAWTVELTDNILLSIDRATEQPIRLTLLDYSVMIRPGPFGWLSFPLHGLSGLPVAERDLVLRVLTSPPVSLWLDLMATTLGGRQIRRPHIVS